MQIWLWSTEWSRAKANRVLPRVCTGRSKQPLPTTQEKTLHLDNSRWSIPKSDWLYSLQPKMERLYTVSKNKTRSWLWLRSWTPNCKFRLKLKKVGETTRSFSYDLNQIPYNYTVEGTDRFKGLDLINRVPEELWTEVCDIILEAVIKTIPKKELQKGKMVVWGGLTNRCEKKRSERQRRKGKIYPCECQVPKNSKERWESLLLWSVQRNRGKQ